MQIMRELIQHVGKDRDAVSVSVGFFYTTCDLLTVKMNHDKSCYFEWRPYDRSANTEC